MVHVIHTQQKRDFHINYLQKVIFWGNKNEMPFISMFVHVLTPLFLHVTLPPSTHYRNNKYIRNVIHKTEIACSCVRLTFIVLFIRISHVFFFKSLMFKTYNNYAWEWLRECMNKTTSWMWMRLYFSRDAIWRFNFDIIQQICEFWAHKLLLPLEM